MLKTLLLLSLKLLFVTLKFKNCPWFSCNIQTKNISSQNQYKMQKSRWFLIKEGILYYSRTGVVMRCICSGDRVDNCIPSTRNRQRAKHNSVKLLLQLRSNHETPPCFFLFFIYLLYYYHYYVIIILELPIDPCPQVFWLNQFTDFRVFFFWGGGGGGGEGEKKLVLK